MDSQNRIARIPEQAAVLDAETAEFNRGPTCGLCLHWRKLPRPPGPVDLSRPVVGECRESLHALPMMSQTAQGPQVLGWIAGYPSGVTADFRACGRFAPRLPLPPAGLAQIDQGE